MECLIEEDLVIGRRRSSTRCRSLWELCIIKAKGYPMTNWLAHSLIYWFHSLSHSLTHYLAHWLSHSLNYLKECVNCVLYYSTNATNFCDSIDLAMRTKTPKEYEEMAMNLHNFMKTNFAFDRSLTHSLTHSLIHSLTRSLTHSLTYLLIN